MDALATETTPQTTTSRSSSKKRDKRSRKVRSAWISFVGRIVAQFVGSAATIVLGLMLLQKHSLAEAKTHAATAPVSDSRVQPVKSGPVEAASVAVLPLRGFTADGTASPLADGVTEALTSELAQIPGAHVASFTSAIHAAQQARSVGEIASTLGVHYVVEGSAIHADGRVLITVRLIDAVRDEHVWARQYDQRAANLLTIEAHVARAAARELGAVLIGTPDDADADAGKEAEPLAASASLGVLARAR
jgi:TolB-like protein